MNLVSLPIGEQQIQEEPMRHREQDLPAVEFANGGKSWWLNGVRHREDGPACEYANGRKFWYLNDEELPVETQLEFEKYKKFKHFF